MRRALLPAEQRCGKAKRRRGSDDAFRVAGEAAHVRRSQGGVAISAVQAHTAIITKLPARLSNSNAVKLTNMAPERGRRRLGNGVEAVAKEAMPPKKAIFFLTQDNTTKKAVAIRGTTAIRRIIIRA